MAESILDFSADIANGVVGAISSNYAGNCDVNLSLENQMETTKPLTLATKQLSVNKLVLMEAGFELVTQR